jgi:hypothetical protein
MSLIGAIRVTMGLDSAAYESRLRRVTRQSQTSFRTIRAAGGALAVGLAAVFSVQAIRRSIEYAGSIGEVAQQLGVAARDLQVYRYAASQSGIAQQEMERGLQRLTRELGLAGHSASQQGSIFTRLGIDVRNAAGQIKSAGDVMPEIADAIARIPDEATRGIVLFRLFGRAGQQLAPLFREGAQGIRDFTQRAEELGLVLSDSEIANADRTADKIAELNQALSANLSRIVSQNADSILKLAAALASLASGIARFLASNPERAYALLGALAGLSIGSRFGPVGAMIGTAAGGTLGAAAGPGASLDVDPAQAAATGRRWGQQYIERVYPGVRRGTPQWRRMLRDPNLRQGARAIRGFDARARGAAGQPPPGAALDIGDLGGGGGGGRRNREDPERQAFEQASALRDLRRDQLNAERDMSRDAIARAGIEQELLALDNEEYRAELAESVRKGDITQAQAEARLAQRVILENLQGQGAAEERLRTMAEEEAELAEARFDAATEALRAEAEMARTAEERRRIELELLDLTYAHRRAKLQAIASDTSTHADDAARRRAEIELAGLDASYRNERAGVVRNTMGPFETFIASLPQTAAEAREALQQVAVDGVGSLVDMLSQAIVNIRSLGDAWRALRNIALQAIADIIQATLRRGLVNLLGGLGGLFGGGGRQITGSALGAASYAGVPGFAGGGSIKVGGMAGIDRNVLSLNGKAIAKVGMGERIRVDPRDGPAGGTHFNFDMRGAVVTEDLLAQMNMIGDQAATRGAVGGRALTLDHLGRKAGRRLGRR